MPRQGSPGGRGAPTCTVYLKGPSSGEETPSRCVWIGRMAAATAVRARIWAELQGLQATSGHVIAQPALGCRKTPPPNPAWLYTSMVNTKTATTKLPRIPCPQVQPVNVSVLSDFFVLSREGCCWKFLGPIFSSIGTGKVCLPVRLSGRHRTTSAASVPRPSRDAVIFSFTVNIDTVR